MDAELLGRELPQGTIFRPIWLRDPPQIRWDVFASWVVLLASAAVVLDVFSHFLFHAVNDMQAVGLAVVVWSGLVMTVKGASHPHCLSWWPIVQIALCLNVLINAMAIKRFGSFAGHAWRGDPVPINRYLPPGPGEENPDWRSRLHRVPYHPTRGYELLHQWINMDQDRFGRICLFLSMLLSDALVSWIVPHIAPRIQRSSAWFSGKMLVCRLWKMFHK